MTTGAAKWLRMLCKTITSRGAVRTASLPSLQANSFTVKLADSFLPPSFALE